MARIRREDADHAEAAQDGGGDRAVLAQVLIAAEEGLREARIFRGRVPAAGGPGDRFGADRPVEKR